MNGHIFMKVLQQRKTAEKTFDGANFYDGIILL